MSMRQNGIKVGQADSLPYWLLPRRWQAKPLN